MEVVRKILVIFEILSVSILGRTIFKICLHLWYSMWKRICVLQRTLQQTKYSYIVCWMVEFNHVSSSSYWWIIINKNRMVSVHSEMTELDTPAVLILSYKIKCCKRLFVCKNVHSGKYYHYTVCVCTHMCTCTYIYMLFCLLWFGIQLWNRDCNA